MVFGLPSVGAKEPDRVGLPDPKLELGVGLLLGNSALGVCGGGGGVLGADGVVNAGAGRCWPWPE